MDPRALHGHRRRELRAHVPRARRAAARACSRATRSSGSTSRSCSVASVALTAMLWGYGIAEGEEAVRTAAFQAISIMTTTGLGERRLRAVAAAPPARALRAHVRRRLGRLDRRLDQGRPPPAPRQGAAARGRPDAEPRGRHADPAQRLAGRRAHGARDRGVHPPLRRVLGGRRGGHRDRLGDRRTSALGTLDALAASATTLGNVGPGFGIAGPVSARSPSSATCRRSR